MYTYYVVYCGASLFYIIWTPQNVRYPIKNGVLTSQEFSYISLSVLRQCLD